MHYLGLSSDLSIPLEKNSLSKSLPTKQLKDNASSQAEDEACILPTDKDFHIDRNSILQQLSGNI